MPKMTLKSARVNAGLKQIEVAEELGVAVSTVRNWEKGITFPKQPVINMLCQLYNVPYDYIDFDRHN
jgi:transcriptional regulator with XRE-family HTH domain